MTAKDKANELGNKFYQGSVFDYDKQGHLDEVVKAKNRAIICVDEILSVLFIFYDFDDNLAGYWKEVKQEIEKL
jgi:hypothetical protein